MAVEITLEQFLKMTPLEKKSCLISSGGPAFIRDIARDCGSQRVLCEVIKVAPQTIIRWRNLYPELEAAIQQGLAEGKSPPKSKGVRHLISPEVTAQYANRSNAKLSQYDSFIANDGLAKIAKLVDDGFNRKMVAEALHISEATLQRWILRNADIKKIFEVQEAETRVVMDFEKRLPERTKYATTVDYWLTLPGLAMLEGWTRDGFDSKAISRTFIGIEPGKLEAWRQQYPQIDEALRHGQDAADYMVERALYRRAVGYNYEENTFEPVLNSETGEFEERLTKRVTKHLPGDVKAQLAWLTNRRPDKWSGSPVSPLDEERLQRVAELLGGVESNI